MQFFNCLMFSFVTTLYHMPSYLPACQQQMSGEASHGLSNVQPPTPQQVAHGLYTIINALLDGIARQQLKFNVCLVFRQFPQQLSPPCLKARAITRLTNCGFCLWCSKSFRVQRRPDIVGTPSYGRYNVVSGIHVHVLYIMLTIELVLITISIVFPVQRGILSLKEF